jgi:hypothetical protein
MKRWRFAVLIAMGASIAAAQRGSVKVTTARANVRQTPSDRGTVVSQVPYGTVLDLAAIEGDWYRVYVPIGNLRVEAYLSKKVATLVSPPAGETAAPATAAAAAPGISMAADARGRTTWLTAAAARAVPVAERPKTLAALAGSPAVVQAAAGRATLPEDPATEITWVWIVDRTGPLATLDDRRPSFFAAYNAAPGVNISDLTPAIVRLAPAGNQLFVAAMAPGRADAAARTERDWTIARDLQQDLIKAQVVAAAAGTMNVRLTAPLMPGDYALVLRPAFQKGYPGREVLTDEGIGSVMSVLWPFTIK